MTLFAFLKHPELVFIFQITYWEIIIYFAQKKDLN